MFVVDQTGVVWRVSLETGEKSVFIDVSNRLVPVGALSSGGYDERVLLEMEIGNRTTPTGPGVIAATSELMRIDPPQFNHNGGSLVFDSGGACCISASVTVAMLTTRSQGMAKAAMEPLIDPLLGYDHDEGISVVGGSVYTGRSTSLRGKSIFGDFLKR